MKLLEMVNEFDISDKVDRAIFEAALKKRIEGEGVCLMDVCYDLYCTQKDVNGLMGRLIGVLDRLDDLEDGLDDMPTPKPKKKK